MQRSSNVLQLVNSNLKLIKNSFTKSKIKMKKIHSLRNEIRN